MNRPDSARDAAHDFEEYAAARWSAHYRTAFLLTHSAADAEDLAQTAMVQAFRHWSTIARTDSPDAYVRRIVVNEFLTRQRRSSLARRHLRSMSSGESMVTPGVENLVNDRVDLWALVSNLPPRQRAVIVLRFYEDYTERQIAGVLGCSVGTVKSQAHAALKSLQSRVTEQSLTDHSGQGGMS